MKIYSGRIAYLEPLGKNVNAASLDTHKEQCLRNPLIYPRNSVCEPSLCQTAKYSLTLAANPLPSPPSSNCHLASEKKAAIITLQ